MRVPSQQANLMQDNGSYFDPFDRRSMITFIGAVVASGVWFLLAAGIYTLLGEKLCLFGMCHHASEGAGNLRSAPSQVVAFPSLPSAWNKAELLRRVKAFHFARPTIPAARSFEGAFQLTFGGGDRS
jgi:hypothetical protein